MGCYLSLDSSWLGNPFLMAFVCGGVEFSFTEVPLALFKGGMEMPHMHLSRCMHTTGLYY